MPSCIESHRLNGFPGLRCVEFKIKKMTMIAREDDHEDNDECEQKILADDTSSEKATRHDPVIVNH